MVLRTARRGRNAGSEFYGCSRYPDCEGTRPLEPTGEVQVTGQDSGTGDLGSLARIALPRVLLARPRFENYQVRLFETAATSEGVLERASSGEIDEEAVRVFSQWRLDFPVSGSAPALDDSHRQVISVLEKILTRGKLTLLSPALEHWCSKTFTRSPGEETPSSVTEWLALRGHNNRPRHTWFDSEEEAKFYGETLHAALGDDCGQFVIPQVEIASLVLSGSHGAWTGSQRVDFAIHLPATAVRVVVEIDGGQHARHADADEERDRVLRENAYTVIRIPAREVREGVGEGLSALLNLLSTAGGSPSPPHETMVQDPAANSVQAMRIAHQIQVVLLQALESGLLDAHDPGLWRITADLDASGAFDRKAALSLLRKSVEDFVTLFRKIGGLYAIDLGTTRPKCTLASGESSNQPGTSLHISFSDSPVSSAPTMHVQDIYVPFHLASSTFPAPPLEHGLGHVEETALQFFLEYLFRKSSFWEGQYEALERLLHAKDALLLLPTGAGKSFVYQLGSLLLPGRTVVIDPIISLMDDQIDNLAMLGIDRCIAITSQIESPEDKKKAMQLFGQGEYLFAFVAPERLQTTEFRDALRALTVHTAISLIVIDEAHCVSEWGHDFRTAYLNAGRTSRVYCESEGHIPPLLAMTGTASRAVLKDVQRELQMEDFGAVITPKSFDRRELQYHIIQATSEEKLVRLKAFLGQKLPSLLNVTSSALYQSRGKESYCGLVFCPWVNGDFGVVHVRDEIRRDLGVAAAMYSGSAPKGISDRIYRQMKRRVASEFKKEPSAVARMHQGLRYGHRQAECPIHGPLRDSAFNRGFLSRGWSGWSK